MLLAGEVLDRRVTSRGIGGSFERPQFVDRTQSTNIPEFVLTTL
jgi:hypothetical protein